MHKKEHSVNEWPKFKLIFAFTNLYESFFDVFAGLRYISLQ